VSGKPGQRGRDQTHPLVKQFCDKYADKANRFVAKALHAKDPRQWLTVESARQAVRQYRGARGDVTRKTAERRGTITQGRVELPKPYEEEWRRVDLQSRRLLVLSDIHVPYHDLQALETAIEYGMRFRPDTILINGDLADYYQISRFPKSKNRPKVVDELRAIAQFFAYLRQQFRRARIVYKHGNHDERYAQYVHDSAPELLEIIDNSWRVVCEIDKRGVDVFEEQEILLAGALPILHGHELPKGMTSPVNPARGAFLRTLESIVVGHHHQTSSHTERTGISGKTISTHSIGCLCGLSPRYARINKWNHGFATVLVDGREFEIENKKIIGGKVY